MDRGKKSARLIASSNKKLNMDLKHIVMENALQFLPAKSIRRFSSVCRDWKLQVSSPFFAHNQSIRPHNCSGFFYQRPSSTPEFAPLDPMAHGVPDPSLSFLPEPVDIRSSSNGLLCCQGRTGEDRPYYVCNPVTKRWKKLPPYTAAHKTGTNAVLIFKPSLLNFVAEYKVICAFPSDPDGIEFEIYSSAEGSWRISPEILFSGSNIGLMSRSNILKGSGVHADGVVYWKSSDYRVIAFDMVSERTTIQYGSHFADGYSSYRSGGTSLGLMNGKLCSAALSHSRLIVSELSNRHTNTMAMHGLRRAWTKNVDVTLDCSELNDVPSDQRGVVALADHTVVISARELLFSYNTITKETKLLARGVDHRGVVIIPYVNSLVEI